MAKRPDPETLLDISRPEGEDMVTYIGRMSYHIFAPTQQERDAAAQRYRSYMEWVDRVAAKNATAQEVAV